MVSYYAQGVQPLHWRGEAIVAMWLRVTGRQREQLPMTTICVDKGRAQRSRRTPEPLSDVQVPVFPVAPLTPEPKRRGRPPKIRQE